MPKRAPQKTAAGQGNDALPSTHGTVGPDMAIHRPQTVYAYSPEYGSGSRLQRETNADDPPRKFCLRKTGALPCRNSRYRHDRKKNLPPFGKTVHGESIHRGRERPVRHDIGNERNRTPVGIRLCGPDRRFRNGGRKVSRLRDRGNRRSRSRRLRSRLRRGVCRSRGRNRASGPSVRNAPRARRDR